jgi:hypothetical protein
MKNQYVGDYNDFVNYALLRAVLGEGLPLTVCWMLTDDDQGPDGGKLRYLEQPSIFGELDREVFTTLSVIVSANERRVSAIEESGLLSGARYYRRLLEDDTSSRVVFFRGLWEATEPGSVLFFDPDNGFEVPSTPRGRRHSAKYVYWDEIAEAFRRGHSVVVLQHFAREKREAHIARLLHRLGEETGGLSFALSSANVAFLGIARPEHAEGLSRAGSGLSRRWGTRLRATNLAQR